MGPNRVSAGPQLGATTRANGRWADDPPFHHQVFVLTHHQGCRVSAGRRDPLIGAGAQAARQTSRRIWPTRWRFFAGEVEIPPWRTGPFEPQSV